MKIRVTKEHIKKGIRTSPSQCPVARALKAKGLVNVGVTEDDINWNKRGGPYQWAATPPTVTEFIRAFDKKQPVKPFSFQLEVK